MVPVHTRSVSDKASLSSLRKAIRADLSRAGVDPSVAFHCLVAVTEACTNALLNRAEAGAEPDLAWSIEPGCARFFVRESCGLASAQASHPSGGRRRGTTLEGARDDLPPGLIASLMDEVAVEEGAGGRTLCLTKHW